MILADLRKKWISTDVYLGFYPGISIIIKPQFINLYQEQKTRIRMQISNRVRDLQN